MFNRVRSITAPIRLPGARIAAAVVMVSVGCASHRAARPEPEPVAAPVPLLAEIPSRPETSLPPTPAAPAATDPLPPPLPVPVREKPAGKPRGGVRHELRPGQTLYALSRLYGVPVAVLIEANGIADPSRIPAGAKILIPGAREVRSVSRPASPRFAWPLEGAITSKFGPRGKRGQPHEGIDIDGRTGDLVRAAADGKVVKAGYGGGYGRMVVIDHGGGVETVYAHASKLLVRKGQRVRKGDPVCGVGMSGNARGSHLHFEVRRDGRAVNPAGILGPRPTGKSAHR